MIFVSETDKRIPGAVEIDYGVYQLTPRERVLCIFMCSLGLFLIGMLFYHNVILSLLLCPFSLYYPRIRSKELIEKRKNELNLQFKDMLYALSSSVSAGKSVESAFRDVLKDLAILYPCPDTYIIMEVGIIIRKIEMNGTIESAFEDFAKRSGLEDIENFTDVFKTCKRTGGNIVEIIKNSTSIINDKIEIKQEIDTILASKRFEQKVLTFLPILMILLLSLTAADYMQPVFESPAGRVVMTVSIALMFIGFLIARKIMDIKV